jgi:iodotyrosine deiodinase
MFATVRCVSRNTSLHAPTTRRIDAGLVPECLLAVFATPERACCRYGPRVSSHNAIPLHFERKPTSEMIERASQFADAMQTRRTVRDFAPDPIPRQVVLDAIRAAGTAPSGAHQQPWTFVMVTDTELKRRIRDAAEVEEKRSWEERMPEDWLAALEPLGLDWRKPHLTDAPVLIIVFAQSSGLVDGVKRKHYYVDESVGIAVGLLLAALHLAGLATLTHTPSPMGFLRELLRRPVNERAFLVIPVGYPAAAATVPDLHRKPLDEILVLAGL